MRIVVLGCTGMLGSMALNYLSRHTPYKVRAVARNTESLCSRLTNVEWGNLDAETCTVSDVENVLYDASWAINAIGVIKPYIRDDVAIEVDRATRVNALFPHALARAAERTGCKILQIATDCVYSGTRGNYSENDSHDPFDVYGKTKSLGEVFSPNLYHLRCSIIGPEMKSHLSLLDWFLQNKQNSEVTGYTNHMWNGVTTLSFAKICDGIFKNDVALPHVQHIIPNGKCTKFELLKMLAESFGRGDIVVKPCSASSSLDRSLTSTNSELNSKLWKISGYETPPTLREMLSELAAFRYSFQ